MNKQELERYYKAVYGKNYKQAINIYNTQVERLKDNFSKKYPNADLDKFEFNVIVVPNTLKFDTSIDYDVTENYGTHITSKKFKDNYSYSLFWTPRIWNNRGTITGLKLEENNLENGALRSFEKFDIYVSESDYFKCQLEPRDTTWENSNNDKDITKSKFNYLENPYFTSLVASYVLSYKSGISLEHFTKLGQPKVISSIARYYFYYHMKRFLRCPNKLSAYVSKNDLKLIQENIPTKKVWKYELKHTKESISYFLERHPGVRKSHYVFPKHNNSLGILGIG